MEGGIRVPTAVMWPNKIPKNSIVSVATSQMDIFATIHEVLNIPLPNDRIIDGKSILPLLSNSKSDQSPHKFLFHYCGTYLHGVRYIESADNIWKLYYYKPKYKSDREYKCEFMCMCFDGYVVEYNPPLLYNIIADPKEDNIISIDSDPKYERIVEIITKAVESHKQSIKSVPNQFGLSNTIWRPWLQPCCQFPTCTCKQSDNSINE